MKIDLDKIPIEKKLEDQDHYKILFSESQSRFVVTVSPENFESFEKILRSERCEGDEGYDGCNRSDSIKFARIGIVQEDYFVITRIIKRDHLSFEKEIVNVHWEDLKESWQKTLRLSSFEIVKL